MDIRYQLIELPVLMVCKAFKRICMGGGKRVYAIRDIAYCKLRRVNFNPQKVNFSGNNELNFRPSSRVSLGDGFICATGGIDNSLQSKIIVGDNATLTIGRNSGMTNTCLHCHLSVTIGDYVNIGAGCMIFDTDFHSTDWRDRGDRSRDIANRRCRPVSIGNYVFVGTRSIIGKGVTIGDKSIVAAGSVVVKDIPAGEIWGGNPARFIAKIKSE